MSGQPLFYATSAAALARTGDKARAEKVLARLNTSDQNPQLEAREATAYLDLGEVEKARNLSDAKRWRQNSQAPAEAYRVLGLLALEEGDTPKAVAEFQGESSAEHEGTEKQLESQALLAQALIESGKTSEGESLRLKTVHANPDLARALFQQGETLLKSGDSQAGYEKFTAAVGLAPHEKDIRAAFDSAKRAVHAPTR